MNKRIVIPAAISITSILFSLMIHMWTENLAEMGGKVVPISEEWAVIGTAENGEEVQIVPITNLNLNWGVVLVYTSPEPFVVNGKAATCTQICTLATNWSVKETTPDEIWAEGEVSIEAQNFGTMTELFILFIE